MSSDHFETEPGGYSEEPREEREDGHEPERGFSSLVSANTESETLQRILSRAQQRATVIRDQLPQALDTESEQAVAVDERIELEREERFHLRRVGKLATELEDISEVEYRRLQFENVVLIGVYSSQEESEAEHSLRELAALVQTAGAHVVDALWQKRLKPDAVTYVGQGKVYELAENVAACGADTVVADTELTPTQRRAIEDVVRVKVIDRTAVILDIFSQHAKNRESKAQVELAQLEYLLPRLRGWGESMSRQAGGQVGSAGAGMGSRGPGERKIELDRRRIHHRIAKLRRTIAAMRPARETKRKNRVRNGIPSVAIVGYTNAGKSSLLNAICHSSSLVQNQLFATLDTAVRKTETATGRAYTLTDTVGFIRNLPHQLVEAFQSTFEEVALSDIVLHTVDGSHPNPAGQIQVVREILRESGAGDHPEIVVFHKADRLQGAQREALRAIEPQAIFTSSRTGEGLDALRERIAVLLPPLEHSVWLHVPYERGDLISLLYNRGEVLKREHTVVGTLVRANICETVFQQVRPYCITESEFYAALRNAIPHSA